MARFTVKKSNVDLLLSQLQGRAEAAMEQCGQVAVEAVQEQMLYGYGTPHGPDGHTEIVDTGRLFGSIHAEAVKVSQNLVSVDVGTDVPYAGYVHDGTWKLEARPFMRDALMKEDTQAKMKTVIVDELSGMA